MGVHLADARLTALKTLDDPRLESRADCSRWVSVFSNADPLAILFIVLFWVSAGIAQVDGDGHRDQRRASARSVYTGVIPFAAKGTTYRPVNKVTPVDRDIGFVRVVPGPRLRL